ALTNPKRTLILRVCSPQNSVDPRETLEEDSAGHCLDSIYFVCLDCCRPRHSQLFPILQCTRASQAQSDITAVHASQLLRCGKHQLHHRTSDRLPGTRW